MSTEDPNETWDSLRRRIERLKSAVQDELTNQQVDKSAAKAKNPYETAEIKQADIQTADEDEAPREEPAPESEPEAKRASPSQKPGPSAEQQQVTEDQRKAILTSQVLKAIRFPTKDDTEKHLESTRAKLEDALAGKTPAAGAAFTPSSQEAKFFQAVINRLCQTVRTFERAMLVVKAPDGKLVATAVCRVEKEYLEQTSLRMLERILKKQKPTMMLDAMQDPVFGSDADVKKNKLRSVLCVPFRYPKFSIRGLMYLDNCNEAGAFTYDHLNRLKEFAELLESGHEFEELEAQPASGQPETTVIPLEPPPPQNYFWVGAVALLLLVMMCSAPKIGNAPQVESTPVVVQAPQIQTRPFGLARDFLRQLREQKYGEAQKILSSRLAAEWDESTLARESEGWFSTDIVERQVSSEEVVGKKGTVLVTCPGDPSAKSWTWIFVKEGDGWKLDKLHSS